MKGYEVMYILKPMANEIVYSIVNTINKLITDNGGFVQKSDVWGKKALAYEIQDIAEGVYVLVTFNAPPSCVKEVDRVMRIKDEILRHMIASMEY